MADDQELKLTVSLVDNATPGLLKLKDALQQIGASGTEKFKRDVDDIEKKSKQIGEHTGKIHEGVNEAVKGIGKFASSVSGLPLGEFAKLSWEATKGIGGFAAAMGGIPLLFGEVNELLGQFADRMSAMKLTSESVGIAAGHFKVLTQNLKDMGLGAEAAQRTVTGLMSFVARAIAWHAPDGIPS